MTFLKSGFLAVCTAGRQRMLTQKMSKESCAAWSGLSSDATMQMFEASLTALQPKNQIKSSSP